MKLVWAVSGRGLLMQSVLEAATKSLVPVRIVGVITDRRCQAEQAAAHAGLPVIRVEPNGKNYDRVFAEALAVADCDWCILTFNRLVGAQSISIYNGRLLNIHYSLLPLFPGFHPVRKALGSGMRMAGVTAHLVDETIDGGTIIAQAARAIFPGDTEGSLGARLFSASVPMLLQVLRDLASGKLRIEEGRPVWRDSCSGPPNGTLGPTTDGDLLAFAEQFLRYHSVCTS